VWEVVRKLNGDKAPGPNGFTMAFFKRCWDVVFIDFQSQRKLEKSSNATFVSLIPKKAGDVDAKDFRQISLVGGVYISNSLEVDKFWI
jgi:hypothetical protein